MKAIIKLDVPEWQIGQDVTVHFPDTMVKFEKCELLKEQERSWIPVSERLPEQEQIPFDCLVALRSGAVREATFLDVDPVHRWCTELHYFSTGDVIAWMPLPEPPKDGDGK